MHKRALTHLGTAPCTELALAPVAAQGEGVLYFKRSTGIYYEPDPQLQEQWCIE